jgi:hypothetical protein
VKGHDASFVVGLNHTEFASLLARNRDCGDGHFCLLGPVEIDHAGDIHAIDVVGSEDGNQVRVRLLDEIHVLKMASAVPWYQDSFCERICAGTLMMKWLFSSPPNCHPSLKCWSSDWLRNWVST